MNQPEQNENLAWTGERFLPDLHGTIVLEHLHRYKAAASLVRGKTVLDIASGEGYGSYLLASEATTVIGVDIDAGAVEHATKKYRRANLRFKQGSCAQIPIADHSVQVIVSFETIEHHDQHVEMMAEIRRVLTPDGLLIISSPNKVEYSEVPGFKNAFHPRELYLEEFEDWLKTGFSNYHIYGQRVVEASVIAPVSSSKTQFKHYIGSSESEVELKTGLDKAVYFLAIASNRSLPELNTSLFEIASEKPNAFIDHAFVVTTYWSDSQGFAEQKSVTKHFFAAGGRQTLEFAIESTEPILELRLDPSDRPALVKIFGFSINGEEVDFQMADPRKQLLRLPTQEQGQKYLVLGDDPQFFLDRSITDRLRACRLMVRLDIQICEVAQGTHELQLTEGTQLILEAQRSLALDLMAARLKEKESGEQLLVANFDATLDRLKHDWEKHATEQNKQHTKIASLSSELAQTQSDFSSTLENSRADYDRELSSKLGEIDQLRAQLAKESELRHYAETLARSLSGSLSWRITAPLRAVRRVVYGDPNAEPANTSNTEVTVTEKPSALSSARVASLKESINNVGGLVPTAKLVRNYVSKNGVVATIAKSASVIERNVHKYVDAASGEAPVELVDELHAVRAFRPNPEHDYVFEIPFKGINSDAPSIQKVAVVAHIFYDEIAPQILQLLEFIPCTADLFISTTSDEKRAAIEKVFSSYKNGSVEVRVFENRGRDIAPKLVGFADVYSKYEYFLHLHSKKTLHAGDRFAHWRDYLYSHLLPSKDSVTSILELLANPQIGIVFAEHLPQMRPLLNWGWNFDRASGLLGSAGAVLYQDMALEFPSGSMFWGRSAAIKPLLDLQLKFADFEQEAGQYDGTLGHAIERSFLFLAETAGYKWAKVDLASDNSGGASRVKISSGGVDTILRERFKPLLDSRPSSATALSRTYPELTPFKMVFSSVAKPRINLLVPSINPKQSFGGIATAIKVFKELAQALGSEYDARVIATDAAIQSDGQALFSDYVEVGLQWVDQEGLNVLQAANDRRDMLLGVRPNDVFLATAWWTAVHGFNFGDFQATRAARAQPLVYLIQDYEPSFYGWSSKWALAEGTYKRPERTIALVNSEELYRSLIKQNYFFDRTFVLPFRLNETIKANLRSVPKEKLLLIYGRPTVERNCTEIVIDALRMWQLRSPSEAAHWKIVSLGESFGLQYALNMPNFEVKGKVTLEEYADLLSRASVGVSLMVSPHPSYPPLEMAASGLQTVTNTFEGKDLGLRSKLIISIDRIDPQAVCDAILVAVKRAEKPQEAELEDLGSVSPAFTYDPKIIAQLIQSGRGTN
jgi:O-antigen biosynthesis protein